MNKYTHKHIHTHRISYHRWWVREIDENLRNKLPHFDSEDWQQRPHTHTHTHTYSNILTSKYCCVFVRSFVSSSLLFFFHLSNFLIFRPEPSSLLEMTFRILVVTVVIPNIFISCANGTNTHTQTYSEISFHFGCIRSILWIKKLCSEKERRQISSMIWMHLNFSWAWFVDGRSPTNNTQMINNKFFFLQIEWNFSTANYRLFFYFRIKFVVSFKWLRFFDALKCNFFVRLKLAAITMAWIKRREHLLVNCQIGKTVKLMAAKSNRFMHEAVHYTKAKHSPAGW